MRVVTAFCLAMAPFALAHAQLEVIGDAPKAPDEAALRVQSAQLETDFNAAQAKAARSGDDKMSCDQIHAELVTTIQSPGFQQFLSQQQAAIAGLAGSTGLASVAGLGSVASLLGGSAGGAGAAAGPSSAAVAQPAGADAAAKKAGLFKKLGSFGQVAGAAASGLGGVGHGVGNAAGTAAGVAAGPPLHAVPAGLDAAALQGTVASAMQVAQAAVASPDVMRAAHLGQLADSKGCKFQMDNPLVPTH
jgi:hypothetical protein